MSALEELRTLLRTKLAEARSLVGQNNAAIKLVGKIIKEREEASNFGGDNMVSAEDIWGELGLGSDVAAALNKKRKR